VSATASRTSRNEAKPSRLSQIRNTTETFAQHQTVTIDTN
jgi:hypothetical protein